MPQPSKEACAEQETPEKRETERQELSENGGRLLSTVCHELRTPLAIIRGYTTLLLDYDGRLENDEKYEYVESIDKATSRLVDLVDHILDMSRLESGLLHLDRAPVSITRIAHEAATEAQLRARGHIIRSEVENGLPRVGIDAKRIRQVLDNILDNAIKYSEEGTEIVVSVVQQNRELRSSVSDQGIGIPVDDVTRVFERLYRVEHPATRKRKGVGLGLAICRGLVEAHGGRIWIESVEGEGSTVCFTVPL